MIEHISFDFDGVLAQGSNEAYVDCLMRALRELNFVIAPEIARARIMANWGIPIKQLASALLLERPELIESAVELFNQARRSPAFLAQVSLFAGAEQILSELSSKHSLSIVSGAERPLIESVLGPELIPLFASIHSASDYDPEHQKPSPYMLERAMQQAKTSATATIYIGDAPNDMRMARNAGVKPVAILTGYLTKPLALELGAEAVIDELTELPQIVTNLS